MSISYKFRQGGIFFLAVIVSLLYSRLHCICHYYWLDYGILTRSILSIIGMVIAPRELLSPESPDIDYRYVLMYDHWPPRDALHCTWCGYRLHIICHLLVWSVTF